MTENNKSNNKKNRQNGPIDIKKIIVFFACAIAVFGAVLVGTTVYKMYSNNKLKKGQNAPSLEISQVDNSVSIKASYDKGIYKIKYYWNENNIVELNENGSINVEKLIDFPPIGNVIHVQVIGIDGQITEDTKNYDNLMPDTGTTVINIELSSDGTQIQITAKNGAGLKYLKYKLNSEEEIRVDAANGNSIIINKTIDINDLPVQVGQNTLYVTAVDMNGNEITDSKPIAAIVIAVVRNDNVLDCTISYTVGFKKIEFNLNGQVFIYDENASIYDPNSTTFRVPIPLQPGDNKLIITAYSLDGVQATYKGQITY